MSVEATSSVYGYDQLRLRDRVLALRSMEPLSPLDYKALATIAEHTRPRRWAKGEHIFVEGEPIEEVQIVTEGLVRVSKNGRHVTDVQRGYGVGFLTTLARDPGGVDAVALEPTRTLGLPVTVLFDSFENNFSLLRNGMRLSSRSVLQSRGNLPTTTITDDADPGVYPERSKTFVERVIEIRRSSLFGSANVDAAVEFVRRSREIRGKAGDVIWRVGDHSDHWFSVQYGRFRCTNGAGVSTTVGAEFILGVMESLAAVPRQYGVVAETDYVIHRTELETMLGITEAHFQLGLQLVATLSQTLLAASRPESDPGDEEEADAAEVSGD